MKYLKRFNENNDNIILDLEDIFVDLKDEGFRIIVNDTDKEYSMIGIIKPTKDVMNNYRHYDHFCIGDVIRYIERAITYLHSNGNELIKIDVYDQYNTGPLDISLDASDISKWDLSIEIESIHIYFR